MEIRRDFYLDKLIKKKNNGLIKVITGIRRCGAQFASTDCPLRMNGAGSSVEAV